MRFFGLLLMSTLAFATYSRSLVWQSEKTLWADAARKSPGLPRPHINLGLELEREGRFDASMSEFIKALKTSRTVEWPPYMKQSSKSTAMSNIALILLVQGHYPESAELSSATLKEFPTLRPALVNRGTAYLAMGRCFDAQKDYLAAAVARLPVCR